MEYREGEEVRDPGEKLCGLSEEVRGLVLGMKTESVGWTLVASLLS